MSRNPSTGPQPGDALVVVDLQRDFLPGGALAVPHGDRIIQPVNRYLDLFASHSLPVFATRDWHPPGHCSFRTKGGPWPVHCVQGTAGAEFDPSLRLPHDVEIISKATDPREQSYSAFETANFDPRLKQLGIGRLWVCGLATEYCVLSTVRDALQRGYRVVLLTDAIGALNAEPNDGLRAIDEMVQGGAFGVTWDDIGPWISSE
jgi:nicotinamidase-related amidase